MDKTIAVEILNQLGGRRFIVMTGAKNFVILANGNGIGFSIPYTNKIKYVRIMLNSMDTYDVEFLNRKVEVIETKNGIYNDQLQDLFTQYTGLYTHL